MLFQAVPSYETSKERDQSMEEVCDCQIGYTYDMNVYAGKETEACSETLGERVVNTLVATIKEKMM